MPVAKTFLQRKVSTCRPLGFEWELGPEVQFYSCLLPLPMVHCTTWALLPWPSVWDTCDLSLGRSREPDPQVDETHFCTCQSKSNFNSKHWMFKMRHLWNVPVFDILEVAGVHFHVEHGEFGTLVIDEPLKFSDYVRLNEGNGWVSTLSSLWQCQTLWKLKISSHSTWTASPPVGNKALLLHTVFWFKLNNSITAQLMSSSCFRYNTTTGYFTVPISWGGVYFFSVALRVKEYTSTWVRIWNDQQQDVCRGGPITGNFHAAVSCSGLVRLNPGELRLRRFGQRCHLFVFGLTHSGKKYFFMWLCCGWQVFKMCGCFLECIVSHGWQLAFSAVSVHCDLGPHWKQDSVFETNHIAIPGDKVAVATGADRSDPVADPNFFSGFWIHPWSGNLQV